MRNKFLTIIVLLAVFQSCHDVLAKIPKASNQGKKSKATKQRTAKRNPNSKSVVSQGVTNQEEEVKLDIVANQETSTNPKAANPGSVRNPRVAIIGNTLSGALSSYYLRKLHPNIDIHVYEHMINREADADLLFHPNFQYINDIVKEKGLDLIDFYRKGLPLIYDGVNNTHHMDKEVFKNQNPNLYEKLSNFLTSTFKDFSKIYKLQSKKKSFTDVHDLLSALSPDFIEYLGKSMNEFLDQTMSDDPNWKKFLEALMIALHIQKFDAHTFIGLACLWYSEITGPLKQIEGEYNEVIEKLFNTEKDEFIKNKVMSMNWKNKKIYINSLSHQEKKHKSWYDFVIIAKADTNFPEMKPLRKDHCEYNKTFLTVFQGSLKITDCCNPGNPDGITHDIINLQKTYITSPSKTRPTFWGTAATRALSLEEISDIFHLPIKVDYSIGVSGYPNYSKFDCAQQAKFDLGRNLYHVNAIAWAAAYPEMMAIGAKNVAFLISSKIG